MPASILLEASTWGKRRKEKEKEEEKKKEKKREIYVCECMCFYKLLTLNIITMKVHSTVQCEQTFEKNKSVMQISNFNLKKHSVFHCMDIYQQFILHGSMNKQ